MRPPPERRPPAITTGLVGQPLLCRLLYRGEPLLLGLARSGLQRHCHGRCAIVQHAEQPTAGSLRQDVGHGVVGRIPAHVHPVDLVPPVVVLTRPLRRWRVVVIEGQPVRGAGVQQVVG